MPRGIRAAGDVIRRTVDGVDTNTIWSEVTQVITALNNERDSLRSLLCYNTTVSAEDVLQAYTGAEFEDASEYGEPVGYRSSPAYFQVGFPFRWRDLGMRTTWKYLIDAPAEQIRADMNAGMEADNRQVFQSVMAALMDPTQRTNENGVPVVGLWNADGTVPPAHNGKTFDGTHNHYITSGSAALEGEDLAVLIELVREHGYGTQTGQLLLFANPQEMGTIRTLRVSTGGVWDFIPSSAAPAYLSADEIVGQVAPSTYGRIPIAGSYGPAWVSENALIPAGYVVAVVSDGANSARNPVAFREHIRPELRGLRVIGGGSDDYPLQDSFLSRGFGAGVRHRGAAAVLQVTTDPTYTAPAPYRHQ